MKSLARLLPAWVAPWIPPWVPGALAMILAAATLCALYRWSVGHVARLRLIRIAVANMLCPAWLIRLGRQVQRPHSTPRMALNVIG